MSRPAIRLLGLGLSLGACLAGLPCAAGQEPPPAAGSTLTLDQCLRFALENNHRRPATALGLQIAEAQHRQALAGYWPQLSIEAGFQHASQTPDFQFPASDFATPAQVITVAPGMTIPIPAQAIHIPEQDVKLMDPDTTSAKLDATWLLWDGGMRAGMRRQSESGVEIARAEVRRTDLEIQDSVTRYYYGAVLARQLHQLGQDTLERMEATLSLTETMYKEGSGRVKKTDWLDNKVIVETIRATVAMLEKNEAMAQAALANTMGLDWRQSVVPAEREIPFEPYAGNLETLAGDAYQWNVDWQELESGIKALEGAETQAASGHYPKLALTVDLNRYWNGYDAGLSTSSNKSNWTAGIGVKIPLFSGQLVSSQVREAHARLEKARQDQFLLKEGIGLMIRNTLLGLDAARKSQAATGAAMDAAVENRELNTRAYESELVDTQDVIKAQLLESLMTAQHDKDRYDHIALQSQLTLLVGSEVWKQLQP
jgi:outer membrane protein TolC